MVEIEWERQLHQSDSRLGMGDGAVVVHERSTRLVRLDPADGSTRWDVRAGRWPRAVVVSGRRCLTLPQDTDHLRCVDLGTGAEVWRVDLRAFTGHVVVGGDTVLVGGWRRYTPLRAVDLATGRTKWAPMKPVHTVRPAATGGGFLTGEPGGSSVRLVDPDDGRQLAEWPLPHPLVDDDHRGAFTPVGDRFVVRCGDHAVVEIAPATGTVRELAVVANPLSVSAPKYAGGLLWLRDRGPGYTVVEPDDGRLLWRVDVGQPLVDQVVAVTTEAGPRFVVASTTGLMFQVDSEGQVVERAAVARRITDLRPLDPHRLLAVTKGTLLAAALGRVGAGE